LNLAKCELRASTHGECQISTFDGIIYSAKHVILPPHLGTTGRTVLVQDVNNTFQVSAVVVEGLNIIQIVTKENHLIQLLRKMFDPVYLLIDNKNVSIDSESFVEKSNIRISKTSKNIDGIADVFHIELLNLGVILRTDLMFLVDIEVSPFYHSKLRGVCGDFDGEIYRDIKTPSCEEYFVNPSDSYYSREFTFYTKESFTLEKAQKSDKLVGWLSIRECTKDNVFMSQTLQPFNKLV
jgi:hypothetical protein